MSNKHTFDKSSSITHIDYHEPDTLEVCFVSGGVYLYPNCPRKHYDALKEAGSPGKHFHAHIKPHFKGVKQ